MINEEIEKIAREYVKEVYDGDTDFIDEAENIIQWLSEKYCIVPKKSVAEWVNGIEFFMPDKRSVTILRIGAKSLFGKELFNEEKE